MRRSKNAPLHEVKQILTTDSMEAANVFLGSGKWILIDTYKFRSLITYVVGRIGEYETWENNEQSCETMEK